MKRKKYFLVSKSEYGYDYWTELGRFRSKEDAGRALHNGRNVLYEESDGVMLLYKSREVFENGGKTTGLRARIGLIMTADAWTTRKRRHDFSINVNFQYWY